MSVAASVWSAVRRCSISDRDRLYASTRTSGLLPCLVVVGIAVRVSRNVPIVSNVIIGRAEYAVL